MAGVVCVQLVDEAFERAEEDDVMEGGRVKRIFKRAEGKGKRLGWRKGKKALRSRVTRFRALFRDEEEEVVKMRYDANTGGYYW